VIVDALDVKKIYKIGDKLSEKFLVEVEGATCSGKSSFVSDICATLKQRGIRVMVVEEAATKVLMENDNLLEQLLIHPAKSNQWKKSKIRLQQRVLSHQIESLEQFAENDACNIALMDRGGASTAYHTISLLSGKEKDFSEEICKEIGKMSSQILLLSPLGFLDKNSLRYQKTLEEIKLEYDGIKNYLDKWKLDYLEIPSLSKIIRRRIGIRCILNLLNKKEIHESRLTQK
jgi:thymidylate kinase